MKCFHLLTNSTEINSRNAVDNFIAMKFNSISRMLVSLWIFCIWTSKVGNALNLSTCSQNNTVLTVKSGTQCKLPAGSYDFTLVQVNGVLHLPSDVSASRFSKIRADKIMVSRNARIKADGYGYPGGQGTGQGTPDGSGGK